MITKQNPVRSNPLRQSARMETCTVRLPGCDGGGQTTVLAHLPNCGRGIGRKASDLDGVHACASCHDQIDGRTQLSVNYDVFLQTLLRAHSETLQRWTDTGLVKVQGAS